MIHLSMKYDFFPRMSSGVCHSMELLWPSLLDYTTQNSTFYFLYHWITSFKRTITMSYHSCASYYLFLLILLSVAQVKTGGPFISSVGQGIVLPPTIKPINYNKNPIQGSLSLISASISSRYPVCVLHCLAEPISLMREKTISLV